MNKLKAKIFPDIEEQPIPQETLRLLKQAWNDLPHDLSQNERHLFIELAEKLIKISSVYDSRIN